MDKLSPDISHCLNELRLSVASKRCHDLNWRRQQLRGIKRLLAERSQDFTSALKKDLGKSPTEAWVSEIAPAIREADYMLRNLHRWSAAKRTRLPLMFWPGSARVAPEPFGLALIVGPWNYPLHLMLLPLIGALAAGNGVVLKPSELAPHSAEVLAHWIPEYLDRACITVIQGGLAITERLLEERFDKIFFTGSKPVAKKVAAAAAKHLTPVTLELGGKCPCLVAADADLAVAARRIVWGKFLNAGQTCIAPDHVLIDSGKLEEFLALTAAEIKNLYGAQPRSSPDYGRIVNPAHFARLEDLLQGATIETGGERDADELYFAPTIVTGVSEDLRIMNEEIFGPILPILAYDGLDEAFARIRHGAAPLAVYVFSGDSSLAKRVQRETRSGAVCLNDVVIQISIAGLPFGGVGDSGIGAYHGRYSFDTFSYRRAIVERATWPDPAIRYPPFSSRKSRWLKRLLASPLGR